MTTAADRLRRKAAERREHPEPPPVPPEDERSRLIREALYGENSDEVTDYGLALKRGLIDPGG